MPKETVEYIIFFDFDGTIADTLTPSSSGMDVPKASSLAISSIFNEQLSQFYHQGLGGLMNRAPQELIEELLRFGERRLAIRERLSVEEVTKIYNDIKLSYLIKEVNPSWPVLFPGVSQFFEAISKKELPVETAIVSSGHNLFIQKVFEVNGLHPPEIVITSDSLQNVQYPERPKFKPSPHQLAKAHKEWLRHNGHILFEGGFTNRNQGKPYIMYVGDDPIKDGKLAEVSRVPFGFVPFSNPVFRPQQQLGQILISNFFYLMNVLRKSNGAFETGYSFAEILFNKKDEELFPPLPLMSVLIKSG